MKYNCPKKQAKAAHLASQDGVASSDSLPPPLAGFDDEHLRHQFQQFQLFQQYQSTQTPSSSFSATLNPAGTSTSFLASSSSHSWIIDSGATDHMTGDRGIMSSFSPTSHSVILADGSHTPIEGIGTATSTSELPLSSVFYLPCFPYNLMSVSKVTCSVTFFSSHCIF